jgi:hypothetical protein
MDKELNGKFWFAIIAAILYCFFGLMQVAAGLGVSAIEGFLLISADLMGGFILLVVGAIFMFGVKEMNSGISEGVSYVYVGIVIALLLSGIYVLILGGNAFGEAIGPVLEGGEEVEEVAEEVLPAEEDTILEDEEAEEEESWSAWDDMKPIIYLGILPLFGFLFWRNRFTLKHLS